MFTTSQQKLVVQTDAVQCLFDNVKKENPLLADIKHFMV